jgi:tetratricopeptide (TPR) repeat protein
MNAALFLTLAASSLAAPALPKRNSYEQATVMTRDSGVQCGTINDDGSFTPTDPLRNIEYRVLKDLGKYLELAQEGKRIFVQKEAMLRLDEALDHYTKMLDREPEVVYWYAYRGWAFHRLNREAEAVRDYSEAIRLGDAAYLRNNRGVIYRAMKKYDDAIADFTRALVENPGYLLAYRNRGQTYSLKKQFAKALEDHETALKLEPANAGNFNAIAWLLATAPDDAIRNGKRAVELAMKACELTGNKNGSFVDTLAAAHAETGDFDKAIDAQNAAIAVGDLPIRDLDAARKRLELYKQKKPYRSDGAD